MIDSAKLAVALFFRCPGVFFSIEEVFNAVITYLPKSIRVQLIFAPNGGAGATVLVANCLWARSNSSGVNHITGDIHYVALALPRKRTILTIHDLRSLEGPPSLKKSLLKLLWFTLPVKHCNYITVISEATKNELLRTVKVNPDKIRVIPDPLSPRFTFAPSTFNEKKPTLLQVGTTDNKNILRLAQALQGIRCRLKILGRVTNEQVNCLKANGVEFDAVAGLSSEDVVTLYRECDMVTFVSTCEGFGLPIIEGNAVGRPVITSTISSMPEVAGDAALLVDPFDIAAIREGILEIITNRELRNGLIERGLSNVKRFQPEVIAKQYADLYEEVYRS